MGQADRIRDLRERIGCIISPDIEFWDAPDFPSKVARGIVAELIGNAKIEWLIQLFRLYPQHYIFWCECERQANPTAIYQRGIQLERIKFVNSAGDLQQPLRLALECGHYPFIIAPNKFNETKVFQRFSLLAKQSKSTLFLLGEDKFSRAWPISLQLRINHSDKGFDISIRRQKHGADQ